MQVGQHPMYNNPNNWDNTEGWYSERSQNRRDSQPFNANMFPRSANPMSNMTVEESVDEVMYNGQSLHGNNPKDWHAMNKYRKSIADKYYNDEMNNLAAIRNYGHRQLNEPEEQLPYPNNSVEGLPSSERNSRAMSRNMDNAINLLQKGANIDQ